MPKRHVELKNVKVEPYTWKAIFANGVAALLAIAHNLGEIANALRERP